MSHNGYTTRIGIFISYTLMRGILGTTHVQPGDGRGGAMGDEESCGKERPEPGRDGTEMQTRAGDRAGVNWSRPLVRRVTIGVAAPLTEVSTSWYSWRPPATLQFKDHWLLSHQLLAYSPFYQSFPLLGRKNKDVQWSFPVFHIKKKTHLQTKNTHLSSSEQCQCEWGGGVGCGRREGCCDLERMTANILSMHRSGSAGGHWFQATTVGPDWNCAAPV